MYCVIRIGMQDERGPYIVAVCKSEQEAKKAITREVTTSHGYFKESDFSILRPQHEF